MSRTPKLQCRPSPSYLRNGGARPPIVRAFQETWSCTSRRFSIPTNATADGVQQTALPHILTRAGISPRTRHKLGSLFSATAAPARPVLPVESRTYLFSSQYQFESTLRKENSRRAPACLSDGVVLTPVRNARRAAVRTATNPSCSNPRPASSK